MSWDLVLAKYDLCLGQGLRACGSLHPALDGDTNPTHDLEASPPPPPPLPPLQKTKAQESISAICMTSSIIIRVNESKHWASLHWR